ncbi:Cna B-type domain-containing protein (plasmid) [Enterococcus gilvus]|jgi:hypothetical protein|uniref:Cna B-type domain-containing protein n=1 Tax=Enterococcus gilvus TaxID=160453 RepID=UPI000DF6339E|nr:Cna B-type domain-containing protein [Enterococcus gilvus]AXG40168.1 Cna B-type domain-containing protein [Enterococcus gilvus]
MKNHVKKTLERVTILIMLIVFLLVFGRKAIIREDVHLTAESFVKTIELDQNNKPSDSRPKKETAEKIQRLSSTALPPKENEENYYIDCTWSDSNNESGDRPKQVSLNLVNEEETAVYSYTVSEGDEWLKKTEKPLATSDYKVSVDVPKGYDCSCQKKQRKNYCLISLLLTRIEGENQNVEAANADPEYE